MAGVLVSEFQAQPGGFGVIVGMDVICHGDFAITNVSGETWISFRTPSCQAIDYVDEANHPQSTGKKRRRGDRGVLSSEAGSIGWQSAQTLAESRVSGAHNPKVGV